MDRHGQRWTVTRRDWVPHFHANIERGGAAGLSRLDYCSLGIREGLQVLPCLVRGLAGLGVFESTFPLVIDGSREQPSGNCRRERMVGICSLPTPTPWAPPAASWSGNPSFLTQTIPGDIRQTEAPTMVKTHRLLTARPGGCHPPLAEETGSKRLSHMSRLAQQQGPL